MNDIHHSPEFRSYLEDIHPGLWEKSRLAVSEIQTDKERLGKTDSFLWEHSIHVAAITYRICRLEGLDPRLPLIAALFHDAGKLRIRGQDKDRPEEEEAALIAERILEEQKLPAEDIRLVSQAINSLYKSDKRADHITSIVHDADFLAKSGHLGVASFFVKNTLRGRSIKRALREHVSKELTYAKALAGNMRTASGRQLAEKNSRIMMEFYTGLLEEIQAHGINGYIIEEIEFPCPKAPHKKAAVVLVLPDFCPKCKVRPVPVFSTREGLKCLKLITKVECTGCGTAYEMAFCLPEMLCP
jgi:putative nucleotidyltransferase with HDIG domain